MPPSLGLALGVLAVSTAAVLIKACEAPPLAIAAWRLGLASLGFLALSAVRRRSPLESFDRRTLGLAAWAGLFLGLHFAAWILSLSYTSVTSSVVLVTTNPLWVGLGSLLFLREPPSRSLWWGLAVALAGSGLVALGDRAPAGDAPDPLLGDLLALGGAWAASLYLLVGRRAQQGVSTSSYVTVVYTVAAAVLLALALAAGTPLAGYAARDWAMLALLALVPQGVGHTLLNRSLRVLPASVVALALLGEPVGASALAWLVLGEAVGPAQALGALLILAGVAWAARPERERGPDLVDPPHGYPQGHGGG